MSSSGCVAANGVEAPKILNRDLSRNSRFPLNGESHKLGSGFAKSLGITHNGRNSVFECIDFSQPHPPRVQMVEGGHVPQVKLISSGTQPIALYALLKKRELSGPHVGLILIRGPMVYLWLQLQAQLTSL